MNILENFVSVGQATAWSGNNDHLQTVGKKGLIFKGIYVHFLQWHTLKLLSSAKRLLVFTEQSDTKMPLLNQDSLADICCVNVYAYTYIYVKIYSTLKSKAL